jgi:RND family efflux transporter MFP subunit
MGMDYIAVYDGEDEAQAATGQQILISTEKIQKLGVRTELATRQILDKVVRASGRVEPDERRLYTIAPKFEGYVERLYVNVTGQPVTAGQPLFDVYSPELVSAQREYAIAVQGSNSLQGAGADTTGAMKQLADASLARLRNWDVSDEQIKALANSGEPKRSLTYRSPANGIVTEKKAVQGMRFMPGEALYQVADLSSVWIIADVFEQDIAQVKSGARVQISLSAYPGKSFSGVLTYIYPTLKPETRTVSVRIELANPGLLLKPGMFAQVELAVSSKQPVITIPTSAVIDSGTRQIALIQAGQGRFEPREIKLGERSVDRVEVLSGLREGESVVVAANFLIDAESNLKAAISGFAPSTQAAPAAGSPTATGHKTEGKVIAIDTQSGSVMIAHGPVPSLKWSSMTMEFQLANSALLGLVKPGDSIAFVFVERGKGEWVITAVKPVRPTVPAPGAHTGH